MIYIRLFLEFFKTGLFAIGGGLATIPFLQDISRKTGWFTSQELVDMIAISESTPGPIGINMATYIGYETANLAGAIIAVIGEVTPSVIIIALIAHYYLKFSEHPMVQSGFYGIRPAVAGLIGAAGFEVAKISLFNIDKYLLSHNIFDIINIKSILLFTAIVFLLNKYKKHPIYFLLGAAIIGIIFKF
ncbi:chromate transporter [Tepidanaerobacter acetatoxydans]|uniref:chromate transporter n=1 Tax=Tepidanaerobacter acetatoxydans TaxID=499229 RepID=UPI001BD3316F|nr:chromate transporter [Tepidanaerobacter acetatoxydans]